ncbi:hypothetical protein ACIRVF_03575 [Kitasatospora sp. NPDC101157]|uniref:hypothetical protein n=1 Tax=Kitasatospora sp. NPDC101157 TaxID=3364098 RepID=UPI0038008B66
MPIEEYLYSADQLDQVAAARDRLTAQCMQRYGLQFTPTSRPQPRAGGQATHRYDVVDPARGYRLPGQAPAAPAPAAPTPPPMTAEQITVLAGNVPGNSKPITAYHGLPVPKGGCLGEADGKLTAQGGSVTDDQLAIGINFDDYKRSMTDGTLQAAFHRWSDCMKARGYSYAAPADAMGDKRWKGTVTPLPEEIATATADAACRQRTNVVGTWYTVESAYEDQAIQANAEKLDQVRRGIAAVVRNAATVNGGGVL